MIQKRTVVVQGSLAYGMRRLQAARATECGLQIMTLPQLAARLAGGFLHSAPSEQIEPAIKNALDNGKFEQLQMVRHLPGMTRAVARVLLKAWHADLSLRDKARGSPRVADLVAIEDSIRRTLAASCLLPGDLRNAALAQVNRAPALLGAVRVEGVHFIDPVWRPLVNALCDVITTEWDAPPAADTSWFKGSLRPWRETAAQPEHVSCADPRHEALEALRWARSLLASGQISASEIAICAVATEEFDEHILSLARAAELPVHFPHGIPCLTTRDGQRCAALADVLLNGLSQTRVRRLFSLAAGQGTTMDALPANWLSVPRGASLGTIAEWTRALADTARAFPDWTGLVVDLLSILEKGTQGSGEAAEAFLRGRSRRLWDRAVRAAPVAALELTLTSVRVEDEYDPGEAIVWCPAWQLAAAPRRHARLLGMTSRGWPRRPAQDPILPDHIVSVDKLDADPTAQSDLRSFACIIGSTTHSLVLSRSRRTAQGSRITASPLYLASRRQELTLPGARIPEHALTESDRLFARPMEAMQTPQIRSAVQCWQNWHSREVTPHDGIVGPNQPVLCAALARVQSPTSLTRLVRDPLGFVWEYALKWRAQPERELPLVLPADAFGRLVHELLRRTVDALEPSPGFTNAKPNEIKAALAAAVDIVSESWPLQRPVPPHVLWMHTVQHAADMTLSGLTLETFSERGTRSWTEVPFGHLDRDGLEVRAWPWNPAAPVIVPGTSIAIRGSIDRVDLRANAEAVRVSDYKTGKRPDEPEKVVIDGGTELQRVLYALACRQLLVGSPAIRARLIYLKGKPQILPLKNLEHTFDLVSKFVGTACTVIETGKTVPGVGAEAEENDLRFALPASPGYFRRKRSSFRSTVRGLTRFWSAK